MMRCLTNLYSHQRRAVDKLIPTKVGALFMEMGTGKTRVAIEFAMRRQARIDRVVWFCPVSLKETISYEIHKHTNSNGVYVFDDQTTPNNLPSVFWYVIGIESMSSSDRVVLAANSLITTDTFVIVDESSYIKGHAALRTRRITALGQRAKYRMILTGTPLSQGIVDLYAQMRFLSPKILGYRSFYSFAANHLEYSEKYPGMIVRAHNVPWLAAKIQPYVYQVTKEECLDLPPKLYDTRHFGMTQEQEEVYQRAKWEILMEIDPDDIDSYVIFRLFGALQQIVSGYWNQNGELIEFPHRRLKTLLNVISNIQADEKIIIWCKYLYSVANIVEVLTNHYGVESVAQLYGGLNEKHRHHEIEHFRQDARFLVATQATGGHGLTLNEAAFVIFYENEFKYANRLQAEDRCHRIGQERRVTYIDLVCNAGIDQRIQDALARKGNVVDAFKRQINQVKDKDDVKQLVEEL